MAINLLLNAIISNGIAGAQDILILAGKSLINKFKKEGEWKKIISETGNFFIESQQEESLFFKELKMALSKENLYKVVKDLNTEDGYDLYHKLYDNFMQLMIKYEIPYEIADSYTVRLIYAVLDEIKTIKPQIYDRYFQQNWRWEQDQAFSELQCRIDKMSSQLSMYNREKIEIISSGGMDINLRKNTFNPSIGIDFFNIDDVCFQNEFYVYRNNEIIFIRGRSIEETVYCILNELWRINDRRPIYVVRNLYSWKKLELMQTEGNIYIPWFYADEIAAIENNTNIFVLSENVPSFAKKVLELRPRTHDTILKCLEETGMDYREAYNLLSDTHGLYSQMKKRIFKGEYLRTPDWLTRLSEKAKKTCVLIGSWEEIEGDKLIIETLYEDSYDKFMDEVLPYIKGDDPLLYAVKHNGMVSYYLSSSENIWSYVNILTSERIWESFTTVIREVINESEKLFTYDNSERLLAEIKGEKIFWSETIRKGLLNTVLIKGVYKIDEENQFALYTLVEDILMSVKTYEQWIYISKFWGELCEISPEAVINRLENEWEYGTGLLYLFQNQSDDFIFGKNSYIEILWGIEQFLTQKEFFWPAFRWLLKLNNQHFEYKSNSPNDIFKKVFCTWMNFSALQTSKEKIKAAEIAFKIDHSNTWNNIFSTIDHNRERVFGELLMPKYREHYNTQRTTIDEMKDTQLGYIKLLIERMDCSVNRWEKMLSFAYKLPDELRREIFEQLFYELNQMPDENVIQIKNKVRHIIFRHRYFASSNWAMPEHKILEYEKLLNDINVETIEYEYIYLFENSYDFPLLHPVSCDIEGNHDENEKAKDNLIKKEMAEFQAMNYDLSVLAKICAKDPYSLLGIRLAECWNDGDWDYVTFKCLLGVQTSGKLAIDYLNAFNEEKGIDYSLIIEDLMNNGYTIDIIASVYRIEATKTTGIPLVTYASEQIKREFWRSFIYYNKNNDFWILKECKRYATLDVYLEQIYHIHYNKPLDVEKLFDCFDGIEKMPFSEVNQMTSYYVEQLISVIQDAYIDDSEKCYRISQLEVFFMGLLEWDQMKCFHQMIKQTPEILAQLAAVIFRKDHASPCAQAKDQTYKHNMYSLYMKAQFCPAEINEKVNEADLEEWIKKFRELLIKNDQESYFSTILGRIFSFSPLGEDGNEPCEAVRKMIEKYGDSEMINSYQVEVINRRGIYAPSAGKEELTIAEEYKKNAEYLEPHYPMTAKIFYGLFESYKLQSKRERIDAENGRH